MKGKIAKLLTIILRKKYLVGLINGAAAGTEHTDVLSSIWPVEHVFDVGANKGQFALVARQCFQGARIDSFEPLAEPAKIFDSVFSKDKDIKLWRYALGEKSGEEEIHVSKKEDSSSLLPISNLQAELFPGTDEERTLKINVKKLEELVIAQDILRPSLLKIDVQGFELSVLKGCGSVLGQIDWIYVECSFFELYEGQAFAGDIVGHLFSEGFTLQGVYNIHYDKNGIAVQADFLFRAI